MAINEVVEMPSQLGNVQSIDTLVRQEMLRQDLRKAIENCRTGKALTGEQRVELKEPAAERRQDLLDERREARQNINVAQAGKDKEVLREAIWDWLTNERYLDELECTMAQHNAGDSKRDQCISRRVDEIANDVRKKPKLVLAMLQELEEAHPWTRSLANKLCEVEDMLVALPS